MDFSLNDYLDEDACYGKLVELLHPDGLACPRCGLRQRLGVHHRHRAPVQDFQCGDCGRVFNAWTGTILRGTHRRPSQILARVSYLSSRRMHNHCRNNGLGQHFCIP